VVSAAAGGYEAYKQLLDTIAALSFATWKVEV